MTNQNDENAVDNAVVIERVFDAAIDQVWQMWASAEHFQQWYGPQGFTIPIAEFDLQVGGRRFAGMESPDGSMKMWFVGEFIEVSAPNRLVYTESMSDENGNALSPADMGMPGMPDVTTITVELEGQGDKTRMVMTHAGVPADSPGASGWAQAFDKLAAALAES